MEEPEWEDEESLSLNESDDEPYDQDLEHKSSRFNDVEDFRSFRSRIAYAREVVVDAQDMWGDAGILSLIHAIEARSGWALEIIADRSELDNVLMERYDIYDEDAWHKLKSSDAWVQLSSDIYEMTTKRMHIIAAELADVEIVAPKKKSIWKRLTDLF